MEYLNNLPQTQSILIDKQFSSNPNPLYGFRLYSNNKYLDIYTHEQKQWSDWKTALSYRCIQVNFHEEFHVMKMIGKGSFAKVYLATKKSQPGIQYAIKAFNKEFMQNQFKGKESLVNEIFIMRQVNSEHLIRLYEVYETCNSIYFVLDIINGGELLQRIKTQGQINQFQLINMMRNMMKALQYLHSKKIVHRDLKPENLLLRSKESDGSDIVLADFGLATRVDVENILFKRCGTPGFVAPEVLLYRDGDPLYGLKCDIFSAGVIFFILMTGKQPFQGQDYKQILKANKNCEVNYDIPELKQANPESLDLLKKMLQADPSNRPSAAEVLQHPFLFQENDSINQQVDIPCLKNLANIELEFFANMRNKQKDSQDSLALVSTGRLAYNGMDNTVNSITTSNSIQNIEKRQTVQYGQSKFCDRQRIDSIDLNLSQNNGEKIESEKQVQQPPVLSQFASHKNSDEGPRRKMNSVQNSLIKQVFQNTLKFQIPNPQEMKNEDATSNPGSARKQKFKLDLQIDKVPTQLVSQFNQFKEKDSPDSFDSNANGKAPQKILKLN